MFVNQMTCRDQCMHVKLLSMGFSHSDYFYLVGTIIEIFVQLKVFKDIYVSREKLVLRLNIRDNIISGPYISQTLQSWIYGHLTWIENFIQQMRCTTLLVAKGNHPKQN